MESIIKREEPHKLIDSIDGKSLDVLLSRLKKDFEVVGTRMDGTQITLGEVINYFDKSREEINKGEFKTIDQLKREAEKW